MTKNIDYLNHKAYFGSGDKEYNFPVDVMEDSSSLLQLISQAKECYDGMENGAVLLLTEKQYIMAFNRGMGRGAHDSAIARIYADLTDNKKLSLLTVKLYCMKAEERLLLARVYSEKETEASPVVNTISFSFNRKEQKISPEEFDSFMKFYDEYGWAIRRYKFKVSFRGRDMSFEDVKERLESMIDKDFHLSSIFTTDEPMIGTPTKDDEITQNMGRM